MNKERKKGRTVYELNLRKNEFRNKQKKERMEAKVIQIDGKESGWMTMCTNGWVDSCSWR